MFKSCLYPNGSSTTLASAGPPGHGDQISTSLSNNQMKPFLVNRRLSSRSGAGSGLPGASRKAPADGEGSAAGKPVAEAQCKARPVQVGDAELSRRSRSFTHILPVNTNRKLVRSASYLSPAFQARKVGTQRSASPQKLTRSQSVEASRTQAGAAQSRVQPPQASVKFVLNRPSLRQVSAKKPPVASIPKLPRGQGSGSGLGPGFRGQVGKVKTAKVQIQVQSNGRNRSAQKVPCRLGSQPQVFPVFSQIPG